MDDFERRVNEEIDRLEGPEFPTGRLARRQREATIRALAEATLEGRSWTGEHGAMGAKRGRMVVSETNFYRKRHWYAHPLVREVIENVTALYLERDAAEREKARQDKRAWLEAKEMEAAETQFAKASDLLSLPHIAKKTKQGKGEEGTTIILDPANAAVFNAAVNLNKEASNLARRSLGLPTDVKRAELSGVDGGPITYRNDEMNEVSDDELRRRIDTLARGALVAIGAADGAGEVAGAAGGSADDDPAGAG